MLTADVVCLASPLSIGTPVWSSVVVEVRISEPRVLRVRHTRPVVNFRGWGHRADLLIVGSADPFATRRGTLRAGAGLLIFTCAIAVMAGLIFDGHVDRRLLDFPVMYSVVFPLIMRWHWKRRQRRN